MPRRETTLPQHLECKPRDEVRLERRYTLLTPLFGGGVSARENDVSQLVRSGGVRGQLRFWWRAARGRGTLEEMRAKEAGIWGAVSGERAQPSAVIVHVHVTSIGEALTPQNTRSSPIPWYAAFPLQPVRNGPISAVRTNVEFTLYLRFPERLETEVSAALWAWETFGGVGGRTRRGFGAINPEQPLLTDPRDGLRKYALPEDSPDNVPRIHPASVMLELNKTWKELLWLYQNFRQDRSGERSQGRSRWCEPDALRRLSRQSLPKHARPINDIDKFPRGQFGLPVIFHFKDAADPPLTQLVGANHERLASPLILRPRSSTSSLALLLDAPREPPGGWALEGLPDRPHVGATLTDAEARRLPMLNGDPDPIRAFLKSLEETP
jgi:CRISPR-associated protein Cmr1